MLNCSWKKISNRLVEFLFLCEKARFDLKMFSLNRA